MAWGKMSRHPSEVVCPSADVCTMFKNAKFVPEA